jgi:hypothetical protein
MVKRGRKSASELATIKANVLAAERIRPPAHLTDAEVQVFNELVADQPATSFTQTHIPTIEMYCRHVVNGRILADEILNFDRSWLASDEGLKRYDKLLAMAERESRAANALARSLRITRQSLHPETAGNAVKNHVRSRKPWELPDTVDMEE